MNTTVAFTRVLTQLRSFIVLIVVTCIGATSTSAQSALRPGSGFVEEVILSGLPMTAAAAFTPDNRIFLAIKDGEVRVAVNNTLLPTPFISMPELVNRSTDRGLLGIAVDPEFPVKPFVYISFVYDPPGMPQDVRDPRSVRVARITADAARDFNVALPDSLEILVGKNSSPENVAPPSANPTELPGVSCMTGFTVSGTPIEDCIGVDGLSHSAGTLIFGPGRTLYASFGDGANYDGPNVTGIRTQSLDTLSGKVIRINPDTGEGVPDNPFYDPTRPSSNRSRLWAMGFRNPFQVTLDPSSGQAYFADVGTSYFEEINSGKGGNFGWPCFEGGLVERAAQEGQGTGSLPQVGYRDAAATKEFCAAQYAAPKERFRPPLYTYRHKYDANGKDLGASVTGIAFYSGTAYPPEYRGALFFGDYALRYIRYLTFDAAGRPTPFDFAQETGSTQGVVQLLTGPDTNLHALYLDVRTRTSQLRRFRYTGSSNTPPVIVLKASPTAGDAPLTVSFRSEGTNDPDGQGLSYEWDFGDGTSSSEPNPIKVFERVGRFLVKLSVRELSATFAVSEQTITIRTGVTPPKVFIEVPRQGTEYRIGDTVPFQGRAAIAGDPTGSSVALQWSVIQRHNDHEHIMDEVSGSSGSFLALEHTDDTTYSVCLFASVGDSLEDQKCVDLQPKRAQYTVTSEPLGAPITYVDEGKELIAPAIISPIVNSIQTLSAPQNYAGRTFIGWSDGVLERERTFTVGENAQTLTARYGNQEPVVSVSASRVAGKAPLVVRFDASRSKDPDGDPLTITWDFGDGTDVRGERVEQLFTRDGVYSVTVTATDTLGAQSSKEVLVTVGKVAQATLGLRVAGQPGCGSEAKPCSASPLRPPRIAVRNTISSSAEGVLMLVLERRQGNRWRRVSSEPIPNVIARSQSISVAPALIRRGGLYRISLTLRGMSTSGAGRPFRSPYRYLRVAK